MAGGYEVIGVQKVLASLSEVERKMHGQIEQATRAAVEDGLEVANSLTPVRTGYLKSRNQVVPVGWQGNVYEADLMNDAEYAIFVELGTVHMPAQPFISPGMEAARQALPKYFRAFGLG